MDVISERESHISIEVCFFYEINRKNFFKQITWLIEISHNKKLLRCNFQAFSGNFFFKFIICFDILHVFQKNETWNMKGGTKKKKKKKLQVNVILFIIGNCKTNILCKWNYLWTASYFVHYHRNGKSTFRVFLKIFILRA